MGWHNRAACKGSDPNIFYDPARTDEAKAVCAGCPVAGPCLREAFENREQGVWGGLTEDERIKLNRKAVRDARTDRLREPVYRTSDRFVERDARPGTNSPHGTRARYVRGCTCGACTTAERLYSRARYRDQSA